MRRALALFGLILGLGICIEAQAPAASSASDPYAGSVKGRVYSNSFFGFSCEIPKGLQSEAELMEKLRKDASVKNKSSLDTIEAEHKRRGILLQATHVEGMDRVTDAIPWTAPNAEPIMIIPRFGASFVIAAFPIPDSRSGAGAMEMAEDRAAQVRANNPGVVVSAPGRVMLNGQEFARFDQSESSPGGKPKPSWFASDFLTVRNGYTLEFLFSADSEKELLRVMKAIQTVHF
ncbi:MAG TPA: hypothetical protein VEG08_02655 [Terriglobales bacterium]|nr:hypothetical protein [Terriglobales bacterium]